jgi:hypothetical protein
MQNSSLSNKNKVKGKYFEVFSPYFTFSHFIGFIGNVTLVYSAHSLKNFVYEIAKMIKLVIFQYQSTVRIFSSVTKST